MFQRTVDFLDSFLKMGLPGYDFCVYKDGEVLFRHWGGYSDLENQIPMNGKEIFNIYSCSKPITCTAAMQLWEKGFFDLEDPLSDYIPEFEQMNVLVGDEKRLARNPIRIKHLFEMTAGLHYNMAAPEILQAKVDTQGKCPTVETIKYLAKSPLLFEPGERYHYSLCHDVIAALVEILSGVRFSEYVEKNIFQPLGMNDATFLMGEDELEKKSPQYLFNWELMRPVNCGKEIRSYKLGSEYESGGAGCVCTVDDYMKFLEALRIGDVILGKDTIKLMATDRLTSEQKEKNAYGYGLGLRCPATGGTATDFGWDGAAGSYLAVDIPNGISLYYAQHMLSSPHQSVRSLVYNYFLAEYNERT